mgnify:CR=1 FL=1
MSGAISLLSCHPIKRSAPAPIAKIGTADAVCPPLVQPKRDFLLSIDNALAAKELMSL